LVFLFLKLDKIIECWGSISNGAGFSVGKLLQILGDDYLCADLNRDSRNVTIPGMRRIATLCQVFRTGQQAIGHGLVDESTKSLMLFGHCGIRACYQTSSHSRRTAWLALSSAGVPSNTIRPWPIT
jgi:hypothetical protein